MPDNQVLYGLDDKPPFPRAVVLGLQHVLTMFGSTVAVPLIFGPVLWAIPEGLPAEVAGQLTELQLTNTALLVSSIMLCSGVATLLQSTFGSRLPIIQGVSFSFLAAFFSIIATTQNESPVDWTAVTNGDASEATVTLLVDQWQALGAAGMQTIAGAIILGAVLEAVIGFTGLMGHVRKVLSPVTVGPVIMLIGLALYQVGAPIAASNWWISLLTMGLVALFSFVLGKRVRFFQLFPMLSAIALSVGVCGVLTATGFFASGDNGYVDLGAYERSEWVRTGSVFFPWGLPTFALSAIIAVLAGYLASMIESFGDYHACSQLAGAGDPTPEQISRGIGFEGVGCALTGVFGGFSSTSYSENIGLVGLTKVGSRYVVQLGAVMLILLGLFGKFGALAAAIPKPVVGGLYCTMFGLISAVGVRQFAKADLSSDRNLFVGGFALFMGLSVPFYFSDFSTGKADVATAIAYLCGDFEEADAEDEPEADEETEADDQTKTDEETASTEPEPSMFRDFLTSIGNMVIALGATGMAVAALLGILLDNLIPGSKKERGLHDPGVVTPQVADVDDVD